MPGKPRPLSFLWVDGFITDPRLPPATRHVLHAIAKFMNPHGVAWPSYKQLASVTGLSVRTVKRHVAAAKKAGWLIVGTSKGPQGVGGRSNLYTVAFSGSDISDTTARGVRGAEPSDTDDTGVVSSTSSEYSGNTQRLRTSNSDQSDDRRGQDLEWSEQVRVVAAASGEGADAFAEIVQLAGFTAAEAAWVIQRAAKVRATTENDGYSVRELAAIALLDMLRKGYRYTRGRLRGFMCQTAWFADGLDEGEQSEIIDEILEAFA